MSSTRVIKAPRAPTKSQLIYTTEFYEIYKFLDYPPPTLPEPYAGPFTSFSNYDDYHLYINPVLRNLQDIPKAGVRLDDLTVSRVFKNFKAKDLNRFWPAEFDTNGMVRGEQDSPRTRGEALGRSGANRCGR